MSFNFVERVMCINGGNVPSPIQFYRKGFTLNGSTSIDWREITISGLGALTLVNSLPDGLTSLKLFGGTEQLPETYLDTVTLGGGTVQNDTPTPQQPLPIWCNNGILKVSPNLFNKNLVPDVNEYINRSTGVTSTPSSGEFRHSDYIVIKENTQYYVGIITSTANTAGLAFYDDTKTLISGLSLTELGNDDNIIRSPNNTKYIRFSFRVDEGYNTNWQNTVYLVEGNQPLAEFMPYGAIYTDGTVETVEVTGANLINITPYIQEKTYPNGSTLSIKADGTIKVHKVAGDSIQIKIDEVLCQSGVKYTLKAFGNCSPSIAYPSIDGTYLSGTDAYKTFTGSGSTDNIIVYSASSREGDIEYKLILVKGETEPTTYEPYFNGGQVTAEMLLAVGDYQDVQSVIDGGVTRNVGIKVLDGTENWKKVSAGGTQRFYMTLTDSATITGRYNVPITHFYFDSSSNDVGVGFLANQILYLYANPDWTVEQFEQWLADQYNAGFPVIVVYPLAEPTTETVTGQTLTTQAGTNIVEITQGSIDGLELEVSYKAVV